MKNSKIILIILLASILIGCETEGKHIEILELIKTSDHFLPNDSFDSFPLRLVSSRKIDSIKIKPANLIDSLTYEVNESKITIRPLNIDSVRVFEYNVQVFRGNDIQNISDSINIVNLRRSTDISNSWLSFIIYDRPNLMSFSVSYINNENIIIRADSAEIKRYSINQFIITPKKKGKLNITLLKKHKGKELKILTQKFIVIDKYPEELMDKVRNLR